VQLSEQLAKEGFDARRLREQVLASVTRRQFDQALVEGVKTIVAQAPAKKHR
jgi:hypothetical protein